ncbi:RNA-directed DNA polymerase-like protein [Tanacetum coccineum]
MAQGDEPITTCVMRYRSYDFHAMSISLTNALATFCTLMQPVLADFIDKFIVVYLDNIVIYTKTIEDHILHLRMVYEALKNKNFYIKKEKCLYVLHELSSLGHSIEKQKDSHRACQNEGDYRMEGPIKGL